MKILIVGYSASGKSTFAKKLASHYHIPVLHLDTIYFKANMEIEDKSLTESTIRTFMKQPHWIIDGTYRYLVLERFEACDHLFIFDMNRFSSFFGLLKRYQMYKHTQRDTMAEGNPERLDVSFIKWILWDGRKKNSKELFQRLKDTYKDKVVVFKHIKDVKRYLLSIGYQGSLEYTG